HRRRDRRGGRGRPLRAVPATARPVVAAGGAPAMSAFPEVGTPADDLLDEIGQLRGGDLDWRGGRAFSLVYDVDDPELERLLEAVAVTFIHENALNPFRYRSLLQMETEIIEAAVDLFGAGCGAISSGGTESIFLAVQTAR